MNEIIHLVQIIISLLENDLYKFSMGAAILHQHSKCQSHWGLKVRNKNVFFTPEMVAEIKYQIHLYCQLRFTKEELAYLKEKYPWLDQDVIDFLKTWQPNEEEIIVGTESECGLTVDFYGSEKNVQWYETPVMAIICEVYYRMGGDYEELLKDFKEVQVPDIIDGLKTGRYNVGCFSEFGFRRRLSFEAQDYFISEMVKAEIPSFMGTSDLYFAKKYNVKGAGTMAHQYGMLFQGYPWINPAYLNKYMLESWVKEFGIKNGIALTDVIGTDVFLRDFDEKYATLFKGVRHDSGDPYVWGEKILAHYKKLGIDPHTKTLLFSDSLSFEKATKLYEYFSPKANVAFGIGGACVSPHGNELNIVIKLLEVDGKPVAKLSDTPGKGMCRDPQYVEYLQRAIDWRLSHEE